MRMNRRKSSRNTGLNMNGEGSEESFHFDSKAVDSSRTSKRRSSGSKSSSIDMQQNTAEFIRYAEGGNNHIKELLEESEGERTTRKEEKKKEEFQSAVWDFFGRFDKESNPDITISEIDLVPCKINNAEASANDFLAPERETTPEPPRKKRASRGPSARISGGLTLRPSLKPSTRELLTETTEPRYPRRNRVSPVKYWIGERVLYSKHREVIGIIKKDE